MAKKKEQQPTVLPKLSRGELSTMVNAYEPSYDRITNPYNTQAVRDTIWGKSGTVGNTNAAKAVFDPNHKTRTAIRKSLDKRRKALAKQQQQPRILQ